MSFRQFFINSQWWGKIIGAVFGYLIGGPAGAFFGILIGNFFDRALREHFSRPHWNYYSEKREEVQHAFFEATFTIMGHIAKSDGRVSEHEILMAKTLMDELRLSREQKRKAQDLFNQGKAPDFDLAKVLTSLDEACHDNPELLKLFMDIQYRAAQADHFTERKIQALDAILRRFGFAPLREQYRFYTDFGFENRQSSSQSSTNHQNRNYNYRQQADNLSYAYAILELNPQANKQEVKKAYRRLISRNHPDRLIAKGLPEEMIKIANDKTQKITKAYEQICKAKGW